MKAHLYVIKFCVLACRVPSIPTLHTYLYNHDRCVSARGESLFVHFRHALSILNMQAPLIFMSLKAGIRNSTCFRKSEHLDKVIGTISPIMNTGSLTYLKNATKSLHDFRVERTDETV